MDHKKYNVIILQTPISESVTTQLAKLFKISSDKAQKILLKDSFVIKKQTDKATAEKFHSAITAAGVNCKILDFVEEEDIALPAIEEIAATGKGKPLTDITRPDITPLHSEHQHLSLQPRPLNDTEKNNQDEVIEDVNSDNFCPECGTIRAGENSVCLHCGYDPLAIKHSNIKTTLIKITAIIVVLSIIGGICFPFYQQYAKRKQIEDDLNLAFETRNTVTEFILKTNFWPNQNIDAGLDKNISNRTLKSVTVGENANITAIIRAQATGSDEQTLIFTPNILKGRIVWNCLKGTLNKDLRPKICQPQKLEY
jgi:Tfp pilus assembly major pilin PilA